MSAVRWLRGRLVPEVPHEGVGYAGLGERVCGPAARIGVERVVDGDQELDGANRPDGSEPGAPEGILDHKITTRKINAQDFAGDLQLRVYSYVKRQSRVGFNVLVRKKSPEIQLLRGKLKEADWNWALNILGYVAQGIQRQVFLPAPPGAWWCSPQWCGYWEECHRELSQ